MKTRSRIKSDRSDLLWIAETAGWLRAADAPDSAPLAESTRLSDALAAGSTSPARQRASERIFSLGELLVLALFSSASLAGLYWLPRGVFAGVTGVATLLGLRLITPAGLARPVIHVGWWFLLAVYCAASRLALVEM